MILIYSTWPNTHEANSASKKLLEEKLIACSNILPAHQSIYFWNEKIQEENEVIALFKTKKALFTPVKEKILALHSYDCPCILSFDIADGNTKFLDWVAIQTLNPST